MTHSRGRMDRIAIAVGMLAAAAPAVYGQAVLERTERTLEQLRREQNVLIDPAMPAERRALMDGGAYFSVSYLSVDDAVGNNHGLRQYDATLYARLNLDGIHEFFVRGITGWRDFNHGDSFDGLGDERIDPDLERAYYRFDLQRALNAYRGIDNGPRVTIQGGRDLVDWGNSLVLSQTLDGLIVRYASPAIEIEGIAGVTPTRTVDFDSSRPGFDHNTRRGFFGVNVAHPFEHHRPYAYALVQRDYNTQDTVEVFPSTFSGFEYNSYYLGVGSDGNLTDRLRYGVEIAFEGGSTLSDARTVSTNGGTLGIDPQSKDDITAAAADVRLDYLAEGEHRTRYSGELILATGDSDRDSTSDTVGGNTEGTSDHAFNAFGLLNTGLAFAPNVSNVMVGRVGVSTFPVQGGETISRLQVGFDALVFGKFLKNGPIDEPTSDDRYLGCEGDLFINWQITSDVTLAARYGAFFPGNAISSNDEDVRQFMFVGVTYGL